MFLLQPEEGGGRLLLNTKEIAGTPFVAGTTAGGRIGGHLQGEIRTRRSRPEDNDLPPAVPRSMGKLVLLVFTMLSERGWLKTAPDCPPLAQ